MSSFSVESFFHHETSTWTHVLYDLESKQAAIFDPVLDYRAEDGHISTEFADAILDYVAKEQLTLKYLIETHIHADHLSAGSYLREKSAAKIVVGKHIDLIQRTFSEIFNEGENFPVDGSQFDLLVDEGDALDLGETQLTVLNTPGHTPACVSFVVNKSAVFIGDTLFMSDTGSARCDFPAGDAEVLYDSVQKLYQLGDEVRMYLCHDYVTEGREVQPYTTVGEQRLHNIHLHQGIDKEDFVALRTERDASLAKPRLILPSLQVNIRAGALPHAENNGVVYLKVPINLI